MVSEFAMAEIRARMAQGVTFSPEEIVRLNALGLEVDHGRDAATDYALPRVVFLGGLVFREPTIAHEIWLDTVGRIVDFGDDGTLLAVYAYALTRDAEKLPDATARLRVRAAVNLFMWTRLGGLTPRQLVAALDYVRNGCDHRAGEFPAPREGSKEEDSARAELECGAVGVMRDAVAVGVGLSLADLRTMTTGEVARLTARTQGIRVGSESDEARSARVNNEFYRTLEAILKEKGSGGNG